MYIGYIGKLEKTASRYHGIKMEKKQVWLMLERDIDWKLKNEVHRRGGLCIKLAATGYAGMPDRLVLIPGGQIVFVELKAPGKHLRPLQKKRFQELSQLGFRVVKIDSSEQVERFIAEVFR